MRNCVIKIATGLVENVIDIGVAPFDAYSASNIKEDQRPPAGYLWVPHDLAGPGWRYASGSFVPPVQQADDPAFAATVARVATDESERLVVRGEAGTLAWLDMTPDQASQWIDDTFNSRVTAGDNQVQAVRFILKRLVRLLLVIARRQLRANASGVTSLSQTK